MSASPAATCPRCGALLPAGFSFCGRCGQPLSPADAAGERRDVAVLFADVQGFTTRSERMDPEEVRDWMGGWLTRFGRVVEEEGGHVDKYVGDGLMALFGAPAAHEDDLHRACRAALGILRMCGEDGPRVRVGLHAGLVVAGRVGAAGAAYTAMGETVNVASRLEQVARPGSALVSAEVARRTAESFVFGPVRRLALKGKTGTVEARELLHERAAPPADDVPGPFVGREREVAELLRRLRAPTPFERWVEVRGELGVGKTRLAREALARAPARRAVRVAATERSQGRAYGLLRLLVLAVHADLRPGTPPPADRDALAGALHALGPRLHGHVAALWDLAAPSASPATPAANDPRTRRWMIEAAVDALLSALAEHDPSAVLVLDGWQWADSDSAALLETLSSRPQGLGVPAVVLGRPEARPPLRGDALLLARLSRRYAEALLRGLAPGAELPRPVLRDLIERAAGVPLHIVEMVRRLVEIGALRRGEDGLWRCDRAAEVGGLPASLRAAMVSRLDRVSPAERAFLGRCAVFGVEFEAPLLEATAEPGDGPAAEMLADLRRRGLVVEVDGQSSRWAFQHPLLAEAAYELLLLQRRRALHGEAAAALIAVAGEESRVAPDLLAHHWRRAETWSAAARAELRAGEVAAGLYLNEAAQRWFALAIESVERLSRPSAADEGVATRALAGAAATSLLTGAYEAAAERAEAMSARATTASEATEAHVLAARALLGRGRTDEAQAKLLAALDGPPPAGGAERRARLAALAQLAHVHRLQGRPADALAALASARELLGAPEDAGALAVQLDSIEGQIAHAAGRFEEARILFERAYAAARRAGDLAERATAGNNLGNVARDRGDYARARREFRRALSLWSRTGDAEAVAGVSVNLANLAMSLGDLEEARRHQERAREAARRIGNASGQALAAANLAILALEQGRGEEAARSCAEALEALGPAGNWLLRAQVLVVLGEAQIATGERKAARATFEEVLERFDEGGHPVARAGALRGLGRLAVLEGDPGGAVRTLEQALERFEDLRREQEAARTLVVLAEAWWAAGGREPALSSLERARERLAAIGARRDAQRAGELLERWRSGVSLA